MVVGVLAVVAVLSPEKADTAGLRRDACGGRMSVVHVLYETPDSVEVRWSVGFLGEKRLTYEFAEMPGLAGGEAQFREVFTEDLGVASFKGSSTTRIPWRASARWIP
ncbi:hypothetical protein [Streptomyces niveus]